MFNYSTVAFLYPGAMGASLAKTLHVRQPHLNLLTSIIGRSTSTSDRATASGLENVPLSDLVNRADVIFSILPPSAAVELAKSITQLVPSSQRSTPPVYIDANAISPGTVSEIGMILKTANIPFLDGCVIGLPAKDGFDPKVYLSCAPEFEGIMKDVAGVLDGGGEKKGLRIEVMENAGEGAASALKMCYGGIGKGTIGLAALMVLTANAHSPATATALLKELSQSRPEALRGYTKTIPDMVGKAYRFVGEMEEISSFISSTLTPHSNASPSTSDRGSPKTIADTFEGLARVFQRVADDLKSESDGKTGKEVEALLEWTKEGTNILRDA